MATVTNKRERGKRRRRARPKRPPQFKYAKDTQAARRKCGVGVRRYYGLHPLQKAFAAFARIIVADERKSQRQKTAAKEYRRLVRRDRKTAAYKKWLEQWKAWCRGNRRRVYVP